MNRDDTDDQQGRDPKRVVQKWVSIGDLMTLVLSLLALGVSYGNLSTRLGDVEQSLDALAARPLTPGAAEAIASLRAVDASLAQAQSQAREDGAEFRREVRAALERIEIKLDEHFQHDRGRP